MAAAAPRADSPREVRLVLREAITLTDVEKHGIPGGGGVREVRVNVYGDLVLTLPLTPGGQPDWPSSRAEIRFLGVNRIGFTGPLLPHPNPAEALILAGDRLSGRLRFPASIKEPGIPSPRETLLGITLDLTVSSETFTYTPDIDPSIPPWRSDKTRPSGRKITGTWLTRELRSGSVHELTGRVAGPAGALRLARTTGAFFPIQSIDLTAAPDGLGIIAHASPGRVYGNESSWAVYELAQPVDLRRFNGLRLSVDSPAPAADRAWPLVPAASLAFRVQGETWFSVRSAVPLLGGPRDHVVDFDLFVRGSSNPGVGAGPNLRQFPDLSRVDAIAIGVANPFGVGSVPFTARSLAAVRHGERGHGEAPASSALITVEPARADSFNGADTVPSGLFGYHIANHNFQSNAPGPDWFHQEPINNDLHSFLRLLRPGSLRPLDHTNFTAETGSGMVRILPADIARSAEALEQVVHTITSENLWARPTWMDRDLDTYAEGVRGMFLQLGQVAWTPEKPDNSLRLIEFWNEPFMWARHINRGQSTLSAGPGDPGGNRGRKAWNDPTQFTYMPGKLGGEIYSKFFNAAASGLRETNTHVKIGGMSSGSFGDDFFSQLTNYVAHFIDGSHEHIDFLTEHHYNTHPAAIAAGYEVTTAWTLARHGKRWPIWNTEANDLDDVAPGDRRSPEAAKAFTDLNRAYYNTRDIFELILRSRDKAAGRALHALWGRGWFTNDGEFLAYLHLNALRGTVLVSSADTPGLLPIAVREGDRTTVYLLNDTALPRAVSLRLAGSSGATVREATGLRLTDDQSAAAILPLPLVTRTEGRDLLLSTRQPIAPRELLRITLDKAPAVSAARLTTQHFADLVIADLPAATQRTTRIALPPASVARARSATLRYVAGDLQSGEAVVILAGRRIALPAGFSEASHHEIVDLPLDLTAAELAQALTSDNHLEVTVEISAQSDGATLYALSLLLTD